MRKEFLSYSILSALYSKRVTCSIDVGLEDAYSPIGSLTPLVRFARAGGPDPKSGFGANISDHSAMIGQLEIRLPAELIAAPRTNRYKIHSLLGRGATSLVYQAIDVEKNVTVALKSIRFVDPQNLYVLKSEFRALSDFYHYNIAQFYDLYVGADSCFFTMELVEGQDLISFARAAARDTASGQVAPIDLRSLHAALAQLCDGLEALHSAGKLHRDIKPSNILVEPGIRTVLLDFGLATDFDDPSSLDSQSRFFAGTPAYMAPERLFGEIPTEASDWYSVGVILYEMLTGSRPYPAASPFKLLEAKKTLPLHPSLRNPGAPEALAELAFGLLDPDPGSRPTIADVRRIVQPSGPASKVVVDLGILWRQKRLFVGRSDETSRLQRAFDRSRSDHRVLVLIEGVSGAGKTALVEQFLAEAYELQHALVLRSRCSYHETVSYNAIDGLVDSLTRFLLLQGSNPLASLAPYQFDALTRVFSVMGRILATDHERPEGVSGYEPHEILSTAVSALKELLTRTAMARPLILWVDDFQWSDKGSIPFLVELLKEDQGPGLQLILSFRSEDSRADTAIAMLELALEDVPYRGPKVHIEVGPLSAEDTATLISGLAEQTVDSSTSSCLDLVRDTGGLPFFALELARYFKERRSHGAMDDSSVSSISDVVQQRITSLPHRLRSVLEVVSVAGLPLAEDQVLMIGRAEAATGADLHRLCLEHLLRKVVFAGQTSIECYHDRIRQAVFDGMQTSARCMRHRQIAELLSTQPDPDHQLLTEHYLGAGEAVKASEHAFIAGQEAAGRLSFDRAIQLFNLALEHKGAEVEAWPIQAELASAYADAGRLEEAAEGFLVLSQAFKEQAPDSLKAATYKVKAGEQLLYCGLLSRGYAVMREVFRDLGLAFPEKVRTAQWMGLVNRIRSAIRLTRVVVRHQKGISPELLLRLNTLWAAARGLVMLDFIVGDAMIGCYAKEAVRMGERSHVLRALGLEAAALANIGTSWTQRRSGQLIRQAWSLQELSQDPYDQVVLAVCKSGIEWFAGRWNAAAAAAQDAIELHRRERGRYDFELAIALGYRVSALVLSGDIEKARSETLVAVEDARHRGDQYVARLFKSGYWVYIGLADDDPETVISQSAGLIGDVLTDRFTSLHWSYFNATVNAMVYAGEPWRAWSLILQYWPSIRRTGFLHLACIGSHLREIRARAALAAANGVEPPQELARWTVGRLIAIAEGDARRIGRADTVSHSRATKAAILCAIEALGGDRETARRLAQDAVQYYDAAQMELHHAAAMWQLGRLTSGKEGVEQQQRAMDWMIGHGVRNPDLMAQFIMPVAHGQSFQGITRAGLFHGMRS